ncbi:MAG: NTP transferase domain-containing protein [Cyanobacteria bacterium]|nr:NTP transferase domain-containing protein [Cyanobacteriota bacterium]
MGQEEALWSSDSQDGHVVPGIQLWIQARMSSRRFPGKVLAPFRGQPLIQHVIRSAATAVGIENVAVLTSDQSSDDPLAAYLDKLQVPILRGPLDDVFDRFRQAAEQWPCERFIRICSDSPLLCADLLKDAITTSAQLKADMITNVDPRTFPKGQSLEIVKTSTFMAINPEDLTDHDREHVTPIFYRRRNHYRILNLRSPDSHWSEIVTTVDTLDDLRRLEACDPTHALTLRIASIDQVS